jgi:hypothetical protein
MHARQMHAHEVHAHEMHTREVHAHEMHAHKTHELRQRREIFDLSPSLPRIGDALGAIFGAKSSAKGVTDPQRGMRCNTPTPRVLHISG